jgi:hypothetical protein
MVKSCSDLPVSFQQSFHTGSDLGNKRVNCLIHFLAGKSYPSPSRLPAVKGHADFLFFGEAFLGFARNGF